MLCKNCERAEATKNGYCAACYSYWHANGKQRPESLYTMPETRPCVNCERAAGYADRDGLCGRCYDYQKRAGKPRPFNAFASTEEKAGLRKALAKLDPDREGISQHQREWEKEELRKIQERKERRKVKK